MEEIEEDRKKVVADWLSDEQRTGKQTNKKRHVDL